MARADLLVSLVKYGMLGDKSRLRKVIEALISEERGKQHNVLANKLEDILQVVPASAPTNGVSTVDQRVNSLIQEIVPSKNMNDLILPEQVQKISKDIIQEHHRSDLLRSYNLEPRNRILLIGPPGNGKTSLAEAIAEALMVPLLVVRYEGVVGAYLGETAVRLRKLIDYACTRKCVLFFDEFETLGKERGDTHETGEIKRVVSSLLLQIDSLPSHVVVIGATNHPELLDRAAWRRFQVRMELPKPTKPCLVEWFERFQKRIKIPLGFAASTLAQKMYGSNFSEVEEFGTTIYRKYVLGQPSSNMKEITNEVLRQWASRTVIKDQQKD